MNPLDELRTELGPDAVLDQLTDMAAYLTDWRGRYQGRARAVVLPRSTAGVAAAVRWCARHGLPLVPQGGNTGLVGGATPDPDGTAIVLCTRRLDRIREVDTVNDTITVEAGCVLQAVQEAARAHGRLFPLSLAAQGSCTIGGNLATNAGGTQVLRYGNARDLTLGLEVVLPDGQVWNGLRALRKDNAGYDLKQLFIGSEGTLGLITAACLRLFPAPRERIVCLLALPSLDAALSLLGRARLAAGPALTAFELMSGDCLALVRDQLPDLGKLPLSLEPGRPWFALLEWSLYADATAEPPQGVNAGRESCLALCAAALAAGLALDAVVGQSLAQGDALWQLREAIPAAQARAGGNVKHDISLPLAVLPEFVERVCRTLAAQFANLQPLIFGHLGDGNLHFNVAAAKGVPASQAFAQETAINDVVYRELTHYGGSTSAEHGVGQLRRALLREHRSQIEWQLMHRIKQALDPEGRMNPGKVL